MVLRNKLYTCALYALAFVLPCAGQENLDTLRQQVAVQQKQIDELRKTLEAQQKLLEKYSTERTPAQPMVASTSAAAISGAVAAQKPSQAVPVAQPKQSAPLSFRIGDAEFTPGGFMDLTSIFRSTNVGSGIGTGFAGIPFENSAAGKTTENRFSGQNSRLTLKVTTNAGNMPVTGYVEADFLGNAPNNLHVSSNANTLRMRLYWVDVRRGKWEVLGGQSWSMLTPGRTGISPMPSDLFYTQDVDTNYQVGLTWTRAPQFRLLYHPNKNVTAGFALENPEQFAGSAVTLPSFATSQVDTGAGTSAPNMHPDIQAKIAFDGKPAGHAAHLEFAGVLRGFRVQDAGLKSHSTHGGGGMVNGNIELFKNFRLFATSYLSEGGGRYIYGLGPDLTVRANGDISLVRAASGIGGFEYTPNKTSQFSAYYGLAYFGRNYSLDNAGKYLGYGFAGSALSNNRSIEEWTVNYTHTFWKSANYGALQLMNQYSYIERTPWNLPSAGPMHAHTHMLYNNLRFVLP